MDHRTTTDMQSLCWRKAEIEVLWKGGNVMWEPLDSLQQDVPETVKKWQTTNQTDKDIKDVTDEDRDSYLT